VTSSTVTASSLAGPKGPTRGLRRCAARRGPRVGPLARGASPLGGGAACRSAPDGRSTRPFSAGRSAAAADGILFEDAFGDAASRRTTRRGRVRGTRPSGSRRPRGTGRLDPGTPGGSRSPGSSRDRVPRGHAPARHRVGRVDLTSQNVERPRVRARRKSRRPRVPRTRRGGGGRGPAGRARGRADDGRRPEPGSRTAAAARPSQAPYG